MTVLTLPPDPGPYRTAVDGWTAAYDRSPGADVYAPNYARWVSTLVAGLMQARPATIDEDPDSDIAGWPIAELVEESAAAGAAVGAVYLRPAFNGERWIVQPVPASHVASYWSHRRLVSATIWSLWPDPTVNEDPAARLAIIEEWAPGGGVTWQVARGNVTGSGTFTASKVWDDLGGLPDRVAKLPAVTGVLEDAARPELGDAVLYPFVWSWFRQHPAPIYVTNETLMTGLERLWDQEQVDAEMVRHRIALDESMIGKDKVMSSDGRMLAPAGFAADANLFALKGGGAGRSQSVEDRMPFHVVTFPDSLTQRDRIERRENAFLEACGINPQSVGRSVSGRSDSAAAKRADQQMTLNTVASPANRLAAALSAATVQVAAWNSDIADGVVEVFAGPKPVSSEQAEEARTLAAAGAASTETLIRTAHPAWTAQQVAEEVARMAAADGAVVPFE